MSAHNQKDFKRIMQFLESSKDFEIEKAKKKNSFMINRLGTTDPLLVHAVDTAFHPIRRWVKQYDINFQ